MLPIPRRILIMSCSQCKQSAPNLLPAIERYDGPSFRVLRRFLRTHPSTSLAIYILSARFGLIPSSYPIPDYDHRMTTHRAQELHYSVVSEIEQIFSNQVYQELGICLGRTYLQAIDGYITYVPPGVIIKPIVGSQGKRLTQLHNWLYGEVPLQFQTLDIYKTI